MQQILATSKSSEALLIADSALFPEPCACRPASARRLPVTGPRKQAVGRGRGGYLFRASARILFSTVTTSRAVRLPPNFTCWLPVTVTRLCSSLTLLPVLPNFHLPAAGRNGTTETAGRLVEAAADRGHVEGTVAGCPVIRVHRSGSAAKKSPPVRQAAKNCRRFRF